MDTGINLCLNLGKMCEKVYFFEHMILHKVNKGFVGQKKCQPKIQLGHLKSGILFFF